MSKRTSFDGVGRSSFMKASPRKLAARFGSAMSMSVPAVAMLFVAGGCQPATNPWVDEFAQAARITTPSVEGVRAANVTCEMETSDHPPAQVPRPSGAVTHGPLYFEDPCVASPNTNAEFAWSLDEEIETELGRARFALDAVLFPLRVIMRPPWTKMISDGRTERPVICWKTGAIVGRIDGPGRDAKLAPDDPKKCCQRTAG